jgi:glutamate--cysteine ligase
MQPTDSINPKTDFTEVFLANAKPATEWAIGAEVELFAFTRDTLGRISPEQVQAVIKGFAEQIIETKAEDDFITEAFLKEGRITLEPGGQIEFSLHPKRSLADIEKLLERYFSRLKEIGDQLGLLFIATGFDPLRTIEEQHWIPKRRYEIMRPYLAKRGKQAWDMMCRTAAIQVNLDYSDLEDMAKKFTLATRLAPVACAIFANSPFAEGKLSGYKSTRYAAWLETDAERTGAAPCALDGSFSLECFIDYVKSVPMFFIRRDEEYINLAGYDFRRFLAEGYEGHTPILQDFTDHLSTIFTEARLKPYIEQRSMDGGQIADAMMAMAFWKGLLYDRQALENALEIAPKMNSQSYAALQLETARYGLEAALDHVSVFDMAMTAVEIARDGLNRIAPDEMRFLDPLEEYVIREKICPADVLIKNFQDCWHGDIRKAMDYLQIRNQ